jgi:hypothetical protein
MTRKRMSIAIKESLKECDEHTHKVADAAVNAAFDYVLEFAQEVSQELVGVGLYSEAMVAGVFVRKLKNLKSEPKK